MLSFPWTDPIHQNKTDLLLLSYTLIIGDQNSRSEKKKIL